MKPWLHRLLNVQLFVAMSSAQNVYSFVLYYFVLTFNSYIFSSMFIFANH